MPVEFRASGYVTVWRGDELISRHRLEREAIESVSAQPPGNYVLRYPDVQVIVRLPMTGPAAPGLGIRPVTSASALTMFLSREGSGPLGVDHYELQRSTDGFNWTTISAAASFDFVDSGLTAATTYHYRARAADSSGRLSDWSDSSSAATAIAGDLTPPSVPTGLAVTQAAGDALLVSWTPSTDDAAVQDYDVLRGAGDGAGNPVGNGAIVATQASSPWLDATGLSPGQEVYYRIRARDTSGNLSGYTSRVFATVEAPAPTTLLFEDGFEAGIVASKYTQSVNGAGTLESSPTHRREGAQALHTRIVKAGNVNYRQEVRVKSPTDAMVMAGSDDYWCGLAIYFPAGASYQTACTVMQFHTVAALGDSPTFSIKVDAGRLQVGGKLGPDADLGAVPTGVWQDFVWRCRFRSTATGLVQCWHNGALIYELVNFVTNPSYETLFPYLKFGLYSGYKYSVAEPDGTVQEAWHDACRIVTGTDQYGAVAPQGNRLAAP